MQLEREREAAGVLSQQLEDSLSQHAASAASHQTAEDVSGKESKIAELVSGLQAATAEAERCYAIMDSMKRETDSMKREKDDQLTELKQHLDRQLDLETKLFEERQAASHAQLLRDEAQAEKLADVVDELNATKTRCIEQEELVALKERELEAMREALHEERKAWNSNLALSIAEGRAAVAPRAAEIGVHSKDNDKHAGKAAEGWGEEEWGEESTSDDSAKGNANMLTSTMSSAVSVSQHASSTQTASSASSLEDLGSSACEVGISDEKLREQLADGEAQKAYDAREAEKKKAADPPEATAQLLRAAEERNAELVARLRQLEEAAERAKDGSAGDMFDPLSIGGMALGGGAHSKRQADRDATLLARIRELEEEAQKARDSFEVNWDALCVAQSRVRELEECMGAQQQEERSTRTIERLQSETAACRENLAESEAEVRRLADSLHAASEQLEKSKGRVEELRGEMRDHLSGCAGKIAESWQGLQALELEVKDSASRELALQELHAAADGYKAELDTSTARVVALEEEVAALQERTAEASSYELALQELQSAADGYKAELEDRTAEASSYELALQELHSAADGYKAELDASTARVKALEEEVAALQRDKERASSSHEVALQELQSAHEKMQNEWRTAEGCKAEVDEASTARVQALQEEIVALQAKAAAASSREEALQELQSAAEGYTAELAAKMQEVPALEHMCITFILHIYNICIYMYIYIYIYRWMRWSEK
jgi:hypothetical protein